MKREVQNVLLILLGGAMIKISLDGSFVRYVKPSLHPYLMASGILIVLLAVAAIAADIRRGGPTDDGHGHDSRPYWLLLIPAAVILFVAPPALGVSSIGERSIAQTVSPEKTAFPPLPGGDRPEIPMLDVVQRAVRDSSGSLDDREISITGFTVATANGGSTRADGTRDGIDLARILIICCAADAQTIRVHLGGNLGDMPDGTWLQVTGIVDTSTATPATGYTPTMKVTDVRRIDAPDNTYAY